MDRETIQTLLDLLNPLHGSLDRQTYDESRDDPGDAEYAVTITAQQERDLTMAIIILENRLRVLSRSDPDPDYPPDHPAPGDLGSIPL
jgi:hypothetical protein